MTLAQLLRGSIIALATVPSACGGGGPYAVKETRDFTALTTWWLGDSFEGFVLSRAEDASFLYGTCEPRPDAGCAPPVQIILDPICSHPAAVAESEPEPFRGAATTTWHLDGHATVRSGTTAITLFGENRDVVRRMADALRSRNLQPGVRPGEPMPPAIDCTGA